MLPKVELAVSTSTSFDLSDEIKTNKDIQYSQPRILAKTYDEFLKLFLSNSVIDHLQVKMRNRHLSLELLPELAKEVEQHSRNSFRHL